MSSTESSLAAFKLIPEVLHDAHQYGGGTLVIDGLSGMGKTYFLRELAAQAQQDNSWAVTFVNADRLEAGEPYSFIERLLASGVAQDWDFTPDAQQQQPIVVARECTKYFAANLQETSGHHVVIMDDTQWIDPESMKVLRYMIPRFNRRNVLIACGARTPHLPSSLAQFLVETLTSPHDRRITLDPLTAQDIQTLAYQRFNATISRRNAEELQELSGGSFLGVDSIFNQITDTEIEKLHTAWNIPIRNVQLKNPFLGEYADLSAAAMGVARIVCLAEHELSPATLRQAIQRLDLEDATAEALRSGVIRESDFGQSIVPRHDLIASAIRETVNPAFGTQIHEVLADLTTGFRSVRHLLKSARTLTPELQARTDQYVTEALEAKHPANASEILRMALELTSEPTVRQRLVTDLVLINIREKTGYQCLDLLGEVEAMPHSVLREFMAVMLRVHLVDEPFPQDRVQALLAIQTDTPDDLAVQAFLLFMMVMMTMRSPDLNQIQSLIPVAQGMLARGPQDASGLTDQRLAWMVTPQETGLLLDCYEIVPWHLNGEFARTRNAIPELFERVAILPDSAAKVDCFVPLAGAAIATGDAVLAHDLAARAVDLLEHVPGEPWAAATPRIILAHSLVLFGEYEQATRVLDDLQEISHETLDLEARLTAAALRAIIDAVTDGQEFARYIGHATRAAELQWEHYGRDLSTMAMLEMARSRGDFSAIVELASDPRLATLTNSHRGHKTFLAHALLSLGDVQAAQERIEEIAAESGAGWYDYWGGLDWLRARLAEEQAQHKVAGTYYRAAVTQDRFPLPHALTVLDYARFLLTIGRISEAETQARAAVSQLTRIGATAYLPAATAMLDQVAEQERQAKASVVSAMTDREREISVLLAQGASNKAIAEDLVISESTVRFHVSNILRKLQVTSRAEVPRVLDSQ